jgi:dipeptidyl aminopeptidase/acylaminoacyl peptidase
MGKPILPDLVYHLKSVADPSLAPDGSRLAYTLSWVDQGKMESRSCIMMLQVMTGETAEFTQGIRDSAPQFSPDGKLLAFLRAEQSGRRQLWLISANGGEARQLTAAPGGVTDFAWSGDSRQLVLCADVDVTDASPDSAADGTGASSAPQVREVRRIRYRYDTLGWRGDAHFHLFVVDVPDGATRQLTDGDWDDLSPAWSPDGSRIAFISGRREDRDTRGLTEAYVVPTSGGEPALWSQDLSSVGAVAWSPDAQKLVAIASESPGNLVLWQGWLYALEPNRPPRRLTDDSLRPYLGFPGLSRPAELKWTQDDRIIFLGDARGESFLYEVSVANNSVRSLAGGNCQSTGFTLDSSAKNVVALSSSPTSPGDLHYLSLTDQASRPLTDHNRDYLKDHPPAQMQKFNIERNGWNIQCRLYLPPDFDPAQRYPLVLDIHGGPNGAFYDSFVSWQQVLATSGYLVLAANPRGSSTYGDDFMMAVIGDWGGEDYLDLMAAVDVVAERPYVDKGRLGVHGYSYGGYMTAWTVGHTNRFKAAVVGAPCIDLFGMYGTSDIGISFGEVQWGNTVLDAAQGSLEQLTRELVERSPITYAPNVGTPVLLLHGEADVRCPISQSEAYFTVLKRLGKEVEMVRFPGCSHLFLRMGHPKMREEYLARTLNWFNRYLSA